jgi:hypothetical protein
VYTKLDLLQIQFKLLQDELRTLKNQEAIKNSKLVLVQNNPLFEIDIPQYRVQEMEQSTTIHKQFCNQSSKKDYIKPWE